jgi:hypothetical protein
MKRPMLLVIIVFVLTTTLASDSYAQQRLEKLSFWEMSVELILWPELADRLDVSPSQLEKIKILRADKEFEKLFFARRRELKKAGKSTDLLLRSFDSTVRDSLDKILDPTQIDGLRIYLFRNQFGFGHTPFEDGGVLEECRVGEAERASINLQLPIVAAELDSDSQKLFLKSGTAVLECLPQKSRELFVEFAGNQFSPRIPIRDNIPAKELPVARDWILTHVGSLIKKESSRQKFTKDELIKIETLLERDMPTVKKYREQKQYPLLEQYFQAAEVDSEKKLLSAISEQTFRKLVRELGSQEFQNFRLPFDRREVCDFLQLARNEVELVRTTAREKRAEFLNGSIDLNRRSFESMCKCLDDDSRQRMNAVFGDVWISQKFGALYE